MTNQAAEASVARALRVAERLLARLGTVPVLLVLFLVAFALHRPDAITYPQLWAEDGTVFHCDADQLGFKSLFTPRMGYFHTLPRLIALGASLFDPSWTPAIYTFAALLVTALVALCLISPRMPGGRVGGLVMALLLLLAPNYSGEVFLTPTNLQWISAPLMAALLFRSPAPSRISAMAEALACFVIGTTSPFSIVLAPIAWAWAALWPSRLAKPPVRATNPAQILSKAWHCLTPRLPVLVGLTSAAALQAAAVLSTAHLQHGEPRPMPIDFILGVLGFRTFVEAFLPQFPSSTTMVRLAFGLATIIGLVTLALAPGKHRPARVLLSAIVAAYFVTALFRCWGLGEHIEDDGLADRYFYAIRIQLVWCVLLAAIDAWQARHWAGIWCGFLVGLAVVASLRVYKMPAWPDERWADYVPAIRAGRPVDIPLNPSWIYHYPGHPQR